MIHIRNGTRVHQLFMLLACVGEYPMQAVYLLRNDRVWKRLIKRLQRVQDFCLSDSGEKLRFQMLTVSGKGKLKTIRLHKSALPVLKKIAPLGYKLYLHSFENHHFSGAITHVSRNHRVAETVAMCMAAGVTAFPWETEDPHKQNVRYQEVERPMFYLSRELKEFYEGEMKKTEFTRIAGALVYPYGVYAVYNTRADHAAHTRQRAAAMPEQRIDQRPVGVAGCGVHHHANGFVDHNDIRILIHHVQ